MSEYKTEIKKLVITINGREEIVPIEDAKKLHAALAELFAKEKDTVWYPLYRDRYFDRWTPMWSNTTKTYVNSDQLGTTTAYIASTNKDAFDTLKLNLQ